MRWTHLVSVAAIALAARAWMAWSIPLASGSADPNCAPDEASHLAVAEALAHGAAPTWPDGSTSIYAAFPPAPYLPHAAALALAGDGRRWDRLARIPARETWARR